MRFTELELNPQITAALDKQHITEPTPIQEQAIPEVLRGGDVLGVAKTGTGKTLAFVLPLLHQMAAKQSRNTATALIVVPTRELAYQVQESCKWFEQQLKIYSTVIVGGVPEGKQLHALKRKPQIVIATPGRLNDLLNQKKLHLRDVEHMILDEADRMFDMGFAPQIREMMRYAPSPQERQTLLFSATMADEVVELIQQYMREPVHIEVATHGSTSDNVQQEVVVLSNEHRKEALHEVLEQTAGAVIVFTRTKHRAKQLNRWLRNEGYKSEEIHGNRSLPQRKKAVAALQSKRSRILVATDIAARGIDISHVELVVNYDLPDNPDDYVHRIGRTGRAKRTGRAISFVITDQADELYAIQKLINTSIEQVSLDSIPDAALEQRSSRGKQQRSRQRNGRNGGYRGKGRGGGRNSGNRNRSGGQRGNGRRGGSQNGRSGDQQRGNSRRSSH